MKQKLIDAINAVKEALQNTGLSLEERNVVELIKLVTQEMGRDGRTEEINKGARETSSLVDLVKTFLAGNGNSSEKSNGNGNGNGHAVAVAVPAVAAPAMGTGGCDERSKNGAIRTERAGDSAADRS